MNKRRYSLSVKSVLVLLLAAVLSFGLYSLLHQIGSGLLDQYFLKSDYIEKATNRTAVQLQEYITENQIQTSDEEKLDTWSRKHLLIYYMILKDGKPVYDSFYTDLETEEGDTYESDLSYMDGAQQYNMEFADGTATVYLLGFFDFQFYDLANYVELGIAAVFFIVIFTLFLQKKIRYVRQLEQEVHILEGGGMNKQITVKGRDELAELAAGLDQMRLSLNENMQEKEELLEANTSLVTGMAHDLRTPLTTLLLYTELLQKGKYKDEAELQMYLAKTAEKAVQIKHMSDQLFARFYVSGRKPEPLEPAMPAEYVFRDELSDFIMFLESQSYKVCCDITWPGVKVAVITDYLGRIFDNISSNLLKYADPEGQILLKLQWKEKKGMGGKRPEEDRKGWMEISCQNKIRIESLGMEGTHVGLRNIEQMMRRMNGTSRTEKQGEQFMICLRFPAQV